MIDLLWERVDDYIEQTIVTENPYAQTALERCQKAGLAPYHVSAAQGKFLHLLAKIKAARKVLEIGALGGYSAIWLASALPEDGKLITMDSDAVHVDMARANLKDAGLENIADVRHGFALDLLPGIATEGIAPFDLFFIDADKWNNAAYVDWALKMSRPDSIIIVDNTVREGEIVNLDNKNPSVEGTRKLYEYISQEKRLSATALQTVGSKGYDGFVLALVLA
jgi:predicted O-methyltransferase YrrM